jgi:hypothetical protein
MPQAFCEDEAWFQNGSTDITTTLLTPKLTHIKAEKESKKTRYQSSRLACFPSIVIHSLHLLLISFPCALHAFRLRGIVWL